MASDHTHECRYCGAEITDLDAGCRLESNHPDADCNWVGGNHGCICA